MRCWQGCLLLFWICCCADSGDVTPDADAAREAEARDGEGTEAGTSWLDCDPTIGAVKPIAICSAADPCTALLPSYDHLGLTEIAEPIFRPICSTPGWAVDKGRESFYDGPPRSWTDPDDPDGVTRYHCEFRPDGTAIDSKRPLVIYVHGSGGSARTAYAATSLRKKAPDFDLSGDPQRPGFVLISVQGRNLHWPTAESIL